MQTLIFDVSLGMPQQGLFRASMMKPISLLRHSKSCAAFISAKHNTRRLYASTVHPQLDSLP